MDWNTKPPFGFSTHEELLRTFSQIATESFAKFELRPKISTTRITECFIAWRYDLEKSVDRFKPEKKSTPDHVKCAGYLMYWIRRNLPIFEVEDTFEQYATDFEKKSLASQFAFSSDNNAALLENAVEIKEISDLDSASTETKAAAKAFADQHDGIDILTFRNHRNRLKSYPNEYIAFDFCYRLARSYEQQKLTEQQQTKEFRAPSETFIDDFCYFLKYKSVSPHSLAFILRTAIQE